MLINSLKKCILDYWDPILGQSLEAIHPKIKVTPKANEGSISVEVSLNFPAENFAKGLQSRLSHYLEAQNIEDLNRCQLTLDLTVVWSMKEKPVHSNPMGNGLPATHIIAVGSGKGGVGKSTSTVNLALALHAEGARVGIFDADIYGPNIPLLLGVDPDSVEIGEKEESLQQISPNIAYDIQTMSIAYLLQDQDTPMIWRAPMVIRALQQLLTQTKWAPLDYLLIDLPPGTGDIPLTLAQKLPLDGAIIVTTPQNLATADAKRALQMFQRVSVPILGVVENMAMYVCPACGHSDPLFGEEGGVEMAADYEVELLGQIPLNKQLCEGSEGGYPFLVASPSSSIAGCYQQIAIRLATSLAMKAQEKSQPFPAIIVEKNT